MTNISFKPCKTQPETDLNRVFGSIFNTPLHHLIDEKRTVTSPVYANVEETPEGYKISLAAPGYQKSEIEISLDKFKLTVKGSKQKNTDIKYTTKEFDFSSFERAFYLPENIEIDKIEAKSENGILSIFIPKAEEKPAINITVK